VKNATFELCVCDSVAGQVRVVDIDRYVFRPRFCKQQRFTIVEGRSKGPHLSGVYA